MERIATTCRKCDWKLGGFVNLWTQIGKTYISPIIETDQDLSVVSTGPVRPGEKQTLVDRCQLQDIACSQCRAVLGLKCAETPVNHVLYEGQIMFRLSSVSVTNLEGQNKIDVNIQRILKLRERPRRSSLPDDHTPRGNSQYRGGASEDYDQKGRTLNAEDEVDFGLLQTELSAQREDILRIDSAGYQIVSSFDKAMSRIEGEVNKLKNGLSDMQRDMDGQHTKSKSMEGNISSLKADVQNVKALKGNNLDFMLLEDELAATKQAISGVQKDILSTLEKSSQSLRVEHVAAKSAWSNVSVELKVLRKELEEAKNIAKEGIATANAYAKDVLAMKAELRQVKEQLGRVRSQRQTPSDGAFPSEELEILTRNITKIGNRAGQVETLQMELQLLKGRVQRVESRNAPAANEDAIASPSRHEAARDGDMRRPQLNFSRKRKVPNVMPTEMQDLSSPSTIHLRKRPALPDWPSSPPAYFTSMSPPSGSAAGANPMDTAAQRLTKSGAIDRRTLRRRSNK